MTKILLRLATTMMMMACLSISTSVRAQIGRIRCATTEHMNDLKQQDPKLEARLQECERILQT